VNYSFKKDSMTHSNMTKECSNSWHEMHLPSSNHNWMLH